MKFFNAFFATLTAALVASTLALTGASWVDGPRADDSQLASASDAPVVLVQR